MTKRRFPLAKVYGLLEPGSALLLTTSHRGESDVMAMSWHTLLEWSAVATRTARRSGSSWWEGKW